MKPVLHTLSSLVSYPKGDEDSGGWREGRQTDPNVSNRLNNWDFPGLPMKAATTLLPSSAVVCEILPCSEPSLEVTGTLLSEWFSLVPSFSLCYWNGLGWSRFKFSAHLVSLCHAQSNAGNKSLQGLQSFSDPSWGVQQQPLCAGWEEIF